MVRDGDFLAATMPALDRVYNLARRLTRHGPDAEDLVQETYLRAWQGWCAGRRPRQVDAWMATICLNPARDAARATRWRTSASTSLKGPRPADHGLRPVLDDAVDAAGHGVAARHLQSHVL